MRTNVLLGLLSSLAAGQVFVPTPKPDNTLSSSVLDGAEISYKKTSICESTEGVTPYSGYVTIPSRHLEDAALWSKSQSAHIFFWYFPARNDASTAPTSIYLAGGPGASSFDSMSSFPCFFNPDSNSTTLNPNSWNNNVNMLYIDQPVGTGFSYVDLANGTFDSLTGVFTVVDDADDMPELNVTTRQVTLNRASSGDTSDKKAMATVPTTTMSAARTLWKFAQVWFQEFPERNTDNDEISIWGSSYGGYFAPAMVSYTADQNDLIADNKHKLSTAKKLNFATLGLLEPGYDPKYLAKVYPEFSTKNTYGIEVYSQEVYDETMELLEAPKEGCLALIDQCRAVAAEGDPYNFGTNKTVNEACVTATTVCYEGVQGAFQKNSNRNPFDITQSNITTWPPSYKSAFLNQQWVQEDLGVPLNYTVSSEVIPRAFLMESGDPMVYDLSIIEKCLESGVNIAMAFGDRDGRCPWIGGENESLDLDFDAAESFRKAGYESIVTNSSYDGGLVRESGSLSFSRIFQSGHGVAGYQPETLSKVFERAIFRRDVATGEVDLTREKEYASQGPLSVRNVTNEVPEANVNVCYALDASYSCTWEQLVALADGSAVVKDWVVVEPKGTNGGFGPSDGSGSNKTRTERNNGDQEEVEGKPSGADKKAILTASLLFTVVASLSAF